jgi:hypothetical protein
LRKGGARPVRLLILGALLGTGLGAAQLPFPQAMSRTWAKPPVAAGTGTAGTAASRSFPAGAVVVRALPGSVEAVRHAVGAAGGRVTRDLPIIDGFAATLPAATAAVLAGRPDVLTVTADVRGHVMSVDPALGYDAVADTGSLYDVEQMIGATAAYNAGWTGKGIDVALIDTGVAPVPGLTSGNVVNGPDLSFDSQHADVRYKDAFGHGTHMASIIAGRDQVLPAGTTPSRPGSTEWRRTPGSSPSRSAPATAPRTSRRLSRRSTGSPPTALTHPRGPRSGFVASRRKVRLGVGRCAGRAGCRGGLGGWSWRWRPVRRSPGRWP